MRVVDRDMIRAARANAPDLASMLRMLRTRAVGKETAELPGIALKILKTLEPLKEPLKK